jgi:hypothetical protein
MFIPRSRDKILSRDESRDRILSRDSSRGIYLDVVFFKLLNINTPFLAVFYTLQSAGEHFDTRPTVTDKRPAK